MTDDIRFFRAKDGNSVYFEWDTEKNDAESTKEGRAIFDKVLRVFIVSPGSPKSIASHVVEREMPDKTIKTYNHVTPRYADEIASFKKAGESEAMSGTPLDMLPFLDMATRAMLRALHIHTVESLAELSDLGVQNVGMGSRQWKEQARAWLESAAGGAPMTRLIAENAKLKDDNGRLNNLVAQAMGRLDALEGGTVAAAPEAAPAKRGPGRPPKAEAAAA